MRCTVKTGYGAAGATTLRIQVTPNGSVTMPNPALHAEAANGSTIVALASWKSTSSASRATRRAARARAQDQDQAQAQDQR